MRESVSHVRYRKKLLYFTVLYWGEEQNFVALLMMVGHDHLGCLCLVREEEENYAREENRIL